MRQRTLEIVIKEVYGQYIDLIKQYETPLSRMLNDILWPDHIQLQHPPITHDKLYTSIDDKRDDSISISQISSSWVAIFQLRPSMASLSRRLFDMAGYAPRMDV